MKGLKLASLGEARPCIIISDSYNLVHWINNHQENPYWRLAYLIEECRWLLNNHRRVKLEFSRREGNKTADIIVNL